MRAITHRDVAHRPAPGTAVPKHIRFSPDGEWLTFLESEPGSLHQRLVAVSVATGSRTVVPTPGAAVDEATLTIEEKLRRERARDLGVGVTSYQWAGSTSRLVVPMADGLWVLDDVTLPARLAVAADSVPGPILDPQVSADGTSVAFVSSDEVHMCSLDGGTPIAVTHGARAAGRSHGLAEYAAQEELDRGSGFWLDPTGRRLAFCEVDESHIPVYRIVHQGSDEVGPGAEEDHRYPFAGAENARVRLAVTDIGGDGEARWLDLGASGIGDDRYLARVRWEDADHLLVQVLDRAQTRLDLVRFDVRTGTASLLLTEDTGPWVNLHDDLRPLPDGTFLWSSERSGYRHLEIRGHDGELVRTLTEGPWSVTAVVGTSGPEDAPDTVWFTSTIDSPLERTVCRVPLGGGAVDRVSGGGTHSAVLHGATGHWADLHQDLGRPAQLLLHGPGSGVTVVSDAADDPTLGDLDLPLPELRTIEAADGTVLHAALYRPAGPGPFPTVVSLYGGPHAQLVTRSWSVTAAMQRQYLREQGFLVAVVDNRGSANRGLDFEAALNRRLGTVEVDDQVALVEALVAEGLADPGRVGVIGWSYGGYLSLMCLARRPDVFRAACAGAPVTDWDGYDTAYTERYMGTPAENPDGYRDAAVATHAEGLRDRDLLLIHGLIDENVHFRHTARLMDALVRADIDHRLLLYPNERHSPRREEDRVSMEHRIGQFFRRSLRVDPVEA